MSDLIIEYKETVDSDCTLPVLTSSKTEGVVLQEEHFGRVQNHDITGYNILPRNYCTYRNRSDGVDFTFNINRCCDKGIISKFYPVFYGNNSDIFFISMVLNYCDEVVREIAYTCTGTGQKVLSFLDLQKMNIRVPSYDEQKKISQYFEQLDNLITLHQRQPFLHSTPEISLTVQLIHPFYTSSWEQRKFEEIAVRSSVICSDDTLPRVEYEDIVSGTGRLNKDIYAKQSIKSGIAFHQGDVLYGKLRPYLQNWLLPTFDGLAVGDFWVLQPQNADSSFLYRLIQSRQFDEVANQSTGTKMPRADWKLVSKTVFSIPSNISEQAAIGTYFTALDSLITLHQRKGKAAVTGCSNDANNSKGVYCKARDFGYKCYKKVKSQQIRCLIAVFIFFV